MGFERGALLALIRHPILMTEAVRAAFAMRRSHGLGLAGPYLAWRQMTAYGDRLATVGAQDMLNYLAWRREMRTIRKWERAV